ncbi:MAG: Permuted papain-like amidase enzyme, YaeF/YiiX, C92 family [uncultured Thiotrichaceae bacterium]|uniref:Permuted papain-like amidase enzyme, YaeF/YiiX, C92 family n=1 Tax=uncultured Thiotrichaceae bacterium TaxID=298394 RepID=A0A6S6S4D9_9GAMM|nr:MAG: Permuted papain-like amidase enzyme, YaeF/YiiX, C92 family [uncultured Thiotrichaceae bacterium]
MFSRLKNWVWESVVEWLNTDVDKHHLKDIYDFDALIADLKPADVVLFEGRSRVSQVIKIVTLSPWTHAALYIDSLNSLEDDALREYVEGFYQGDPDEPLIIESLLGHGTIVNPISMYRNEHIRICRPLSLQDDDRKRLIRSALGHLGLDYDVRQLLDLARLMFPYGILPRKWRSSLFRHNVGKPTQIVCSSMIARCFQKVNYPIVPIIQKDRFNNLRFYKRNFRLFVPSDFDYSPFFEVIKYPSYQVVRQIISDEFLWYEDSVQNIENEVVAIDSFSSQGLVEVRR